MVLRSEIICWIFLLLWFKLLITVSSPGGVGKVADTDNHAGGRDEFKSYWQLILYYYLSYALFLTVTEIKVNCSGKATQIKISENANQNY